MSELKVVEYGTRGPGTEEILVQPEVLNERIDSMTERFFMMEQVAGTEEVLLIAIAGLNAGLTFILHVIGEEGTRKMLDTVRENLDAAIAGHAIDKSTTHEAPARAQ